MQQKCIDIVALRNYNNCVMQHKGVDSVNIKESLSKDKERSEIIGKIIEGVEKYGYKLTEYDLGYAAGMIDRAKVSTSNLKIESNQSK